MNIVHCYHVHFTWYVFVMSFLCSSRASYGYIRCGFISNVVWRLSNTVPVGVEKLSLDRQNFYMYVLGIVIGYWLPRHLYIMSGVCLSIHLCGHLDVCLYVHLYVHWYIHISVITLICPLLYSCHFKCSW